MRSDRFYRVPGTDRERTLERMSVPEVHAFVADLRGQNGAGRAIAAVVSSYRQRLTGLLRATVLLVARRGELPRGALAQLRTALAEVGAQLGARARLSRAGP